MAVIFSDTFTGSNGDLLQSHTPDVGTSWTKLIDTNGARNLKINASNQLKNIDGIINSTGLLYTADVSYPSADYEVQVTMVTPDTGDDTGTIAVRIQDANNMYVVNVNNSSSSIWKCVGGVWTQLTSGAGVAAGSVLKFTVVGTALEFFDDGVSVLSITDNSITASGKAGIGMGAIAVSTDDLDQPCFDDFSVNNLGSGATPHSVTKSLQYTVKAPASLTKSLKYTVVIVPAGITKSLKYTVKAGLSITKSLKYTVYVPKSLTKSLRYATKAAVSVTKSLRYVVIAPHAIQKSLKYTVTGVTNSVTKSLAYRVRVALSVTKSLRYTVTKTTVITKQLRYALTAISITTRQISKSLRYAVRYERGDRLYMDEQLKVLQDRRGN